jgi:hypothetical protein
LREVEQREEKTARELLSRMGLADKAKLLAGTLHMASNGASNWREPCRKAAFDE